MLYRKNLRLLISLCIVLFNGTIYASDENRAELEYLLKAKVIHTISLFISWPTLESSDDFSICVLGVHGTVPPPHRPGKDQRGQTRERPEPDLLREYAGSDPSRHRRTPALLRWRAR